MADIFVSYKKADQSRVEPIVAFFERHGLSVFWDTRIDSGERWDCVIEREISEAKCIVVVWTPDSVSSRWVRTEADEGLERGNLVPLLMGVQKPPIAFKLIQATDITGWSGGDDAPVGKQVLEAVSRFVNRENSDVKQSEQTASATQRRMYVYVSGDKLRSLAPECDLSTIQSQILALPMVTKQLAAANLINPGGPYFAADMDMRWGVTDFGNSIRVRGGIALFYNEDQKLLLCGSPKHVLGITLPTYECPSDSIIYSGSLRNGIVGYLIPAIESEREDLGSSFWFNAFKGFIERAVGRHLVKERLCFVARHLGDMNGLIIGSPIWVAFSDEILR